jgi:hypothetical protein
MKTSRDTGPQRVTDRRYDLHTRSLYTVKCKRSIYWSCVIYYWKVLTWLLIYEKTTDYVFSTFKVNELISVADGVTDRRQDRQYTYNVILRRVRVVIVAVESNEYYVFRVRVCSLRYPACNAHVPYYFVNIFPYYHIKVTIKKMFLNTKCVFGFLYSLYLEHFSF